MKFELVMHFQRVFLQNTNKHNYLGGIITKQEQVITLIPFRNQHVGGSLFTPQYLKMLLPGLD